MISGKDLQLLLGEPVNRIRVYAYNREKGFKTIPFQIDEKGSNNEYIFPEDKPEDDKFNIFSKNDELVIMVEDLGDEWNCQGGPECYLKGLQVEVTDPKDKGRGWAYIFAFNVPPAANTKDYVEFKKDDLMIHTDNYRLRFYDKVPAFPDITAITKDGGGDNRNFLDKISIQFFGKVKFGFSMNKTEQNIIAENTGVKDGMIRVIYRCVTRIHMFWKIYSWPFPQKSFF